MSQKSFDGLLLIDKPTGITSHDVVARVRRILGTKAVGHTGTLDPLASGMMVLLINEATKLSQYILERDKEYVVSFCLGQTRDTLDCTGTVLTNSPVTASAESVQKLAQSLTGEFEWPVPLFSATKVDGVRLYEHARKGETEVVRPVKRMSFDLKSFSTAGLEPHGYQAHLRVSKGSFIRSWVSELGERLGCGAVMTALRRTVSEPYALDRAVGLDDLEKFSGDFDHQNWVVPMGSCLASWKVIRAFGQDLSLMKNGSLSNALRQHLIAIYQPDRDEGVKILTGDTGQLLALVGLEKEKGFRVLRVFNTAGV